MINAVYFESWNEWRGRLKNTDPKFNVVNLAFADPRKKFDDTGSGLSFTSPIQVVKDDIRVLKENDAQIMLSVGGATFPFPLNFDAFEMVKLANFLGCDGIDIDWEPMEGSTEGWAEIIKSFDHHIKEQNGSCYLISAAVWATGCMQPRQGDRFRGVNIPGLVAAGALLDWLNIMAYDAGPPSNVDPLGCFYTYRIYYPGPLVLGFQVGKMGWGDYLTTKEDVIKGCQYAAKDSPENGTFIWSYFKNDFSNDVTRDFIVEESRKAFGVGILKPPEPQNNCKCPHCGNMIKIEKI